MQKIAANTEVYASSDIKADLQEIVKGYSSSTVFLLTDEGSYSNCRQYISSIEGIDERRTIVIPQGDENKNIETANKIWQFLSTNGATRHSLLINLGGGMPCDLGGFCASTFKRGIDFVNIPTTILAQVDASLGGKTGLNLGCLKNEIGVFASAKYVLISSMFIHSLNNENLLSGFAEMIKHALIADVDYLTDLKQFDTISPDYDLLQQLVCRSIEIKDNIVTIDPHEKGLRKALNFGHTFGHAFETYSMRIGRPILHGIAVAYGMVCELMLSRKKISLGNSSKEIEQYITDMYGAPALKSSDFDALIELMHHDKKNDQRGINFSLIPQIGRVEVNQIATESEIREVLDEYLKTYIK